MDWIWEQGMKWEVSVGVCMCVGWVSYIEGENYKREGIRGGNGMPGFTI